MIYPGGNACSRRKEKELFHEVPQVLLIFFARLLVGFRHIHRNQIPRLFRVHFVAFLAATLPELLKIAPVNIVVEIRQREVAKAFLRHVFHGLDAANAGNPNRRMRFLTGLGQMLT